jgi:hypothetical protein
MYNGQRAEHKPARDWQSVIRDAAQATLERSCQANLPGFASTYVNHTWHIVTCQGTVHGRALTLLPELLAMIWARNTEG